MLQPKLRVALGDANRILLVFSVTLLIYANPALSQLGELSSVIKVIQIDEKLINPRINH